MHPPRPPSEAVPWLAALLCAAHRVFSLGASLFLAQPGWGGQNAGHSDHLRLPEQLYLSHEAMCKLVLVSSLSSFHLPNRGQSPQTHASDRCRVCTVMPVPHGQVTSIWTM